MDMNLNEIRELAETTLDPKERAIILFLCNCNAKLLAECIKAKTVIGQLRPSKCLCNITMVHFCERCSADLAIKALSSVIKETKNL